MLTREPAPFSMKNDAPVTRRRQPLQAGSLMVDRAITAITWPRKSTSCPGRRPHPGALSRSRARGSPVPSISPSITKSLTRVTILRLRHGLLRRPRRPLLAGALRAAVGRNRHRLGVSLPRAPLPENGLMIVVSQSGETADTLAALRYAKSRVRRILSIVNVETSTIARESDVVARTLAGPEIGVASTKAFTCQLASSPVSLLALAAPAAC